MTSEGRIFSRRRPPHTPSQKWFPLAVQRVLLADDRLWTVSRFSQMALMTAVVENMDGDGVFFLKAAEWARKVQAGDARSIRQAVNDLRKAGLIEAEPYLRPHALGQGANTYRIDPAVIAAARGTSTGADRNGIPGDRSPASGVYAGAPATSRFSALAGEESRVRPERTEERKHDDADEEQFKHLIRDVGAISPRQREIFVAAWRRSPDKFERALSQAISQGRRPAALLSSLLQNPDWLDAEPPRRVEHELTPDQEALYQAWLEGDMTSEQAILRRLD